MDPSTPRPGVLAHALAKSAALSQPELARARKLDGMEPVLVRLRERGRLGFLSRGLMRAIGAALSARAAPMPPSRRPTSPTCYGSIRGWSASWWRWVR